MYGPCVGDYEGVLGNTEAFVLVIAVEDVRDAGGKIRSPAESLDSS